MPAAVTNIGIQVFTLRCIPSTVDTLVEPMTVLMTGVWNRIECMGKFAALDFGGEWLFFPTSGLNPNNGSIEVYYNSLGGQLPQSDWPKWRERHNVTFAPRGKGQLKTPPNTVIHSREPRKSLAELS